MFIEKLEPEMGFCGIEIKWMMSYFSEREQVVKIRNVISKELNDSLEVLQA